MPFNIGPIELLLLVVFFLPTTAGFWIWHAKRQRSRWVGASVGFALGLLSIVGWVVLVLVAALWKPEPEVDVNRKPLAAS